MNTANPFFIIGAQRSGTTLLRLILNAHSQLSIPEEGTFWMPILRDYKRNLKQTINRKQVAKYFDYIRKNSQFKLWKLDIAKIENSLFSIENVNINSLMSAIYTQYMQEQKKIRWGDKTPSFFRMTPVLSHIFPKAKFIHIIRDGRDIHLSLQKMGLYRSNLSVDALEWSYKVRKAQDDLIKFANKNYIEVRYEDIIYDFDSNIKKICAFLNIPYESQMSDFWQHSSKYIGSHHSKKIFQPISKGSVEKWKRNMSRRDIHKFETICGGLLNRLNYPVVFFKSSFSSKKAVFFDLAWGLPARVTRLLLTHLKLKIASKFGIATDAAGKGEIASD